MYLYNLQFEQILVQETVKDIQQTFGMFPGFFKNTPKDVLPQMWPLFKKYQIGESIIPKKYREMMMLASAAATKCPYCQTYHREVAKMLGATEQEFSYSDFRGPA